MEGTGILSTYSVLYIESLFISDTTFSQRHIVHDLATLHTICIFLCISRDLQNVKKLDHRLILELGKNNICRGDGHFPRVLFDGHMGDFAIINNEHVSLNDGIINRVVSFSSRWSSNVPWNEGNREGRWHRRASPRRK